MAMNYDGFFKNQRDLSVRKNAQTMIEDAQESQRSRLLDSRKSKIHRRTGAGKSKIIIEQAQEKARELTLRNYYKNAQKC